jgi:hypothetical protein
MTDKWGRRLFKTGAVMLVLLGLVHSLSLFEKPVPANDTGRQLLDLMANYKFNLMGSGRSMADLMYGFSVAFMVAAFGLGILDLLLVRRTGGTVEATGRGQHDLMVVMTAVSLRFFFAAPTSLLAAALLIFALAWLKLPTETRIYGGQRDPSSAFSYTRQH